MTQQWGGLRRIPPQLLTKSPILYNILSDFHTKTPELPIGISGVPYNSYLVVLNDYIIPPMPAPAGIAGVSSLMLATADSVVRNVEATLVAF